MKKNKSLISVLVLLILFLGVSAGKLIAAYAKYVSYNNIGRSSTNSC